MTEKEKKEFYEWALNDHFLSQFKRNSFVNSNEKLFSIPKNSTGGGYFLRIMNQETMYTYEKYQESGAYFGSYFAEENETVFDDLDLEKSKKYVYDLAKWGIKQHIKCKKLMLKRKLNGL